MATCSTSNINFVGSPRELRNAVLPCNSIWWTRGIKACILQRIKAGCGSMTTSQDVVEVFEEYV
ncbi:hypothetical protein SNOG_03501 [Parastagonospora nodorum SN15]|uniref:Uncharacterized protein n=1 Tax=Phaeosphaeria nodorum (strain SN15 / ATCC MYA-4574 / FGSC 10173) TaxID=321614 RepID=Q0UXL3_PHANO|nr:hypothetical protein SNOG_03501 [Parastagonospora nodorum SN15]EAT88706.1 hypothetical protein SNOG_03501 [Parastagonospora nodorum SN15]